jgi:dephospho-CoA kinase
VIGKIPVIGLTGGIGSGKSLVARLMGELGAKVFDADETAHEVLADSEVVETLKRWWGPSVVDRSGQIDRRRIAEIVFKDPGQRQQLERLVHPRIFERWGALLHLYRDEGVAPIAVVIDAPLLFEAGLDEWCDVIVFVDAPENVRLQRLRDTRGWAGDELRRREKMQNTLDSKRIRADYIVENNSSVCDLRRRVEAIFSAVTSLAT